jgi:hypothetical protein
LWIARWKRHCTRGWLAAQQQAPGVLDGVHLAEDRLDDRLRRAKVARAFFVRSLRAMRCLGVAVFDTGPRGARGSAAFSATRAPASAPLAQDKAWTAAAFGQPTDEVWEQIKDEPGCRF